MAAPTKLHHAPEIFDTLALPGDFATMRYSLGQLDRAARLQFRLEPQLRAYRRWLDLELDITVYVLTRKHWDEGRIAMPYGVPVRVGRAGLAAPAESDDSVIRLWAGLDITLPNSTSSSLRGLAQQGGTAVMADFLSQLLTAEIVVDQIPGLAGNKHWVRGFMAQLALVSYFDRVEEETLRDLDLFFTQVLAQPRERLAASDYHPDVRLGDWLWFQARFYQGAKVLVEKEGRDVLKRMMKLRNRNDGLLTDAALLDKYKEVSAWYHASFAAVSTRPGRH
ncbi:MAG: hypothetical protein MPN21_16545 [Thermoanaerobaculia bacterium]|nr:hypothetical protein [Thermoanaerobaculia bacterium]